MDLNPFPLSPVGDGLQVRPLYDSGVLSARRSGKSRNSMGERVPSGKKNRGQTTFSHGTDYLTTIILSDFDINNLDNSDFLF